MKAIIQVVKSSSVSFKNNDTINKIDKGLNILVGFIAGDNKDLVAKYAKKIINMRIFMDDADKMNLSVLDVQGEILSISQFTLYADTKRGNRPGFSEALEPKEASILYDYFNECLRSYNVKVLTGEFGADMVVQIENEGPTTIILESE